MNPLILVPVVVVVVGLLIRAHAIRERRQVYVWKPLATLLVIAVAALSLAQPSARPLYTAALLVGLSFSLAGDVALMFDAPKAFLTGLVCFLLAHVVYSATFVTFAGRYPQQIAIAAVVAAVGVLFYRYLYPGLGQMRLPVACYAFVISIMVLAATGTLFSSEFTSLQGWLVTIGAVLFYVSDMILAVNRFLRPLRNYALANLSTYYGGQLLIALSAAYFASALS